VLAITLAALESSGEHVIAAWPAWFRGGHHRLAALLDQHRYDRERRSAWERSTDGRYRIAPTVAYDRDGDQVVLLAVLGAAAFRKLSGGPARPRHAGGDPR
jgi:hypothetical protein